MRNKHITLSYYVDQLDFKIMGDDKFPEYLMLVRDNIEIHFFLFEDLDPLENYGQVYIRASNIKNLYQTFELKGIAIHPNGRLQLKPWGQLEFSLLDPDHNLLTFGG